MNRTRPQAATLQASAIIVDAQRGTRHLDQTRSLPASLEVPAEDRPALDWVLNALTSAGIRDVTYVGSYHIEKVIEAYPGLEYRFHRNWRQEGEVAALRQATEPTSGVVVVRAGTVCVASVVARLCASHDSVAVGRYRSDGEMRFAGLVWLPAALAPAAFQLARRLSESQPAANLESWLAELAKAVALRDVDLDGLAAPARDRPAVVRTIFAGKARTLEQVGPLVRTAVVLPQLRILIEDWVRDPDGTIRRVEAAFGGTVVAVRSSAHAEDHAESSAAGRFRTVLGVTVPGGSLRSAITAVAQSYTDDGRESHSLDEILVQPQITDLASSGVVLTRDLGSGAPYYVINLDRSGRSDLVTSGSGGLMEAIYVARSATPGDLHSAEVRACVGLARELEDLTRLDALDIEFGIDRSARLYLFQVRPLGGGRSFELADDDLDQELDQIARFVTAHQLPHPLLAGSRTVFGTMPDWNPVEMIGATPRPLALSLYQKLVGATAWAEARALIGYRDVRPEPLIVSLGGRPYVDVRASLNSLLPAGLPDAVASVWVDACLGALERDARLHDKLEFDVAITCLTPDFARRAERLRDAGLSDDDVDAFRMSLATVTTSMLSGRPTTIEQQLEHLAVLAERRARLHRGITSDPADLCRRIAILLDDCQRLGVVPFAVLARNAFVALDVLAGLRAEGVLSSDELAHIQRTIPTVAGDLSRDIERHAGGVLSTQEFVSRYGHLRPSSYDITSRNYAAAWQDYTKLDPGRPVGDGRPADRGRDPLVEKRAQIDAALRRAGLDVAEGTLADFVRRSIPARELAKFEFMKSVDAALELMARLGAELGFDRDEMSFLPIEAVVRAATESFSAAVRTELRRTIEFNKKRWNLTCALRLPHVIVSPAQVRSFSVQEWTPNFITDRRVVAPPVAIDEQPGEVSLDGVIVLIRAADPGYDWLFAHRIAGLVTEFGGVASHMAIRAAEFGLPAAIGCGELLYERLRTARMIELDCRDRKVRSVP